MRRLLPFVAVALASCSGQPSPDPPGGPLTLIPSDATMVAQVDIEKLHSTRVWESLVEERKANPRVGGPIDILVREGRWDPFTQLESMTCAANAPAGHSMMCILKGTFDEEHLIDWVNRRAEAVGVFSKLVVPAAYNSVRYYRNGFGDRPFEAVFLGHSMLVVGTTGWGRKVIDVMQGHDQPARFVASSPTDAAWFSARLNGLEFGQAAIQSAAARINLMDGFATEANISGVSDRDGAAIQERVAQLFETLRKQPDLAAIGISDVLDHVATSPRARGLSLQLVLSPTETDAFADRILREANRHGPAGSH